MTLPALDAAMGLRLLLDPLLKGLALLLLVQGALYFLQAAPARWRSAVWTILFTALIALPLTVALNPRLVAPLVTVAETPVAAEAEVAASPAILESTAVSGERPDFVAGPLMVPADVSPVIPWWHVLILVWIGGTLALTLRMVLRLISTGWALRHVEPATDPRILRLLAEIRGADMGRHVRLYLSSRFALPFVAGVVHPRLVLPQATLEWSDDEIRAVLHHELAHIRRLDLLRMILADLACALHWPNPLVWRASSEALLAHEMACDDHAARVGEGPRQYARLLLSLASLGTVPAPGMARTSGLERRLRHVLSSSSVDLGPRRRWVSLTILGSLAVLMVPVLAVSTVKTVVVAEEALPMGLPVPEVAVEPAIVSAEPAADIHHLSRDGRTREVLDLLAVHPDLLERRDERGMTPLATAAWHDQTGLVTALLLRGADPDSRNDNGLTPMFCALDRGRNRLPHVLADHGANLLDRGYHGWTLLHAAARAGNRSFVKRLLAAGVNPNITSTDGRTPLHWAQRLGDEALIGDLLAGGALDVPNPKPFPTGKKLLDKR